MKSFTLSIMLALLCSTAAIAIEAEDVRRQHLQTLGKLDADLSKFEQKMAALKLSRPDQRKATCESAASLLGMLNNSIWSTTEDYRQKQIDNLASLQTFANMIVDTADLAKKKGCYDFADTEYRKVIATFVGLGYVAQRQRAEIGINDIRQAKAK